MYREENMQGSRESIRTVALQSSRESARTVMPQGSKELSRTVAQQDSRGFAAMSAPERPQEPMMASTAQDAKGVAAGMPHRARRAIIMAAGAGKRMFPLTQDTPKPLVRVNGIRMIDSVIEALHQNGIYEIYVVVGYLREKFQDLPQTYPGLRLLENPWYAECNNISSLYVAREYIPESVILDGDQMVYHPEILKPEFERSCYCCRWVGGGTSEWLLQEKGGVVTGCSRTGGACGWQLYSISFWTREDGTRLRSHLELEFEEKKNRQIFWDDVPIFCHPEEYQLGIREIQEGDLVEIDDLQELSAIDASYRWITDGF